MTKGLVLGRSSTPPRPTLHSPPGFGQETGERGLAPISSSSSACRPQDSAPPALTRSSLGKESGIHSVSGSREPSEKDEDKCGPAYTQECPGPPDKTRPPGCLGPLFCGPPEERRVNKWDALSCGQVYYQAQNIRTGRGFRAQLVQAPYFTDEETEVKRVKDFPRSHSVSATGLG